MSRQSKAMDRGMVGLVAAGLIAWAGTTHAQPDGAYETTAATTASASATPATPPPAGPVSVCLEAFNSAQQWRDEDKLIDTRRALIACSQKGCPKILRSQCATWLDEVRLAVPSIVVAAKNTRGEDMVNVRLFIDGELATMMLTGRPIELEPGRHALRAEHLGARPIDRHLVIQRGVRNRSVVLDFGAFRATWGAPTRATPSTPTGGAAPTCPPPLKSKVSTADLVVGGLLGVGAAGLLVGMTTGIIALTRSRALKEECASPRGCLQDEVDEAEMIAHTSTGAFAVAGVSVLGATVTLLFSRHRAPVDQAQVAGIRLVVGDGTVGVAGSF
jgi:hypothetical protein